MGSTESATPADRRACQCCGGAVVVLGVLALLGWALDWRALAGVRADYIPMAPNSAFACILLGAALACHHRLNPWLVRLAVLAVALVTGLRAVERYLGLALEVDEWFWDVAEGQTLDQVPLGVMAGPTAVGFLMASGALLIVTLPARPAWADHLAGLLALLVTALGVVFSLGYLYGAPLLLGEGWIPMALNTAVAFILLGVGLLAALPSDRLPRAALSGSSVRARLLRAFLPFALATVVLVTWVTVLVVSQSDRQFVALYAGFSAVLAMLIACVICARIARRIGGQIDLYEDALRLAQEQLEARVRERTQELSRAKRQLEDRNRQLQQAAAELAHTAESVRTAHRELQEAHLELQKAETQLVQTEKLSALGQMVAGVAHEINNPLAFVINNVAVLQRDVAYLHNLIRLYQQGDPTLAAHEEDLHARIRQLADQFDLAYVLDHMQTMMARSREGLRRIQQIVKDLRDFARLDESDLHDTDLNSGILLTVNIVQTKANEHQVTLDADLGPLPAVTCYPAKINQVVLNLLTNAIDACPPGGRVTVRTHATEEGVAVEVADTGPGIDPAIRDKIFDPFFTTKPIGQGTGLGLSISYGIVQQHGGRIDVHSAPGQGTRFVVHLPLDVRRVAPAMASS